MLGALKDLGGFFGLMNLQTYERPIVDSWEYYGPGARNHARNTVMHKETVPVHVILL